MQIDFGGAQAEGTQTNTAGLPTFTLTPMEKTERKMRSRSGLRCCSWPQTDASERSEISVKVEDPGTSQTWIRFR